jgi:hypothetical protein
LVSRDEVGSSWVAKNDDSVGPARSRSRNQRDQFRDRT